MSSLRKMHGSADWARKKYELQMKHDQIGPPWEGWPAFYDATRPLLRAAINYQMTMSKKNYDRLIAAALAAHATDGDEQS